MVRSCLDLGVEQTPSLSGPIHLEVFGVRCPPSVPVPCCHCCHHSVQCGHMGSSVRGRVIASVYWGAAGGAAGGPPGRGSGALSCWELLGRAGGGRVALKSSPPAARASFPGLSALCEGHEEGDSGQCPSWGGSQPIPRAVGSRRCCWLSPLLCCGARGECTAGCGRREMGGQGANPPGDGAFMWGLSGMHADRRS